MGGYSPSSPPSPSENMSYNTKDHIQKDQIRFLNAPQIFSQIFTPKDTTMQLQEHYRPKSLERLTIKLRAYQNRELERQIQILNESIPTDDDGKPTQRLWTKSSYIRKLLSMGRESNSFRNNGYSSGEGEE